MKFLRVYRNSHTARAITRLTTGNAAAHMVTLIALPIVTRLYTPSEIGVISLFLAFVGFWGAIATLRLESALLVAGHDDVFQLQSMALWISALMACAGAATIDQAIRYKLAGFGILPFYTPLFAILVVFLFGVMMTFRAISLRDGNFGVIANAAMLRSAGNAVTRISAYLLGIFGLFLAEVAGYLFAVALLWNRSERARSENNSLRIKSIADWKRLTGNYRKYIFLETPSVMVNQAALLLPLPAITAIYGPAAAGWFGLARMAVAIPNAQIGRAVADVYQKEAAEYFRNGELGALRGHFLTYAKKLALFGLLPYGAIMLLAPLLAPLLFGKGWEPMGILAAILAPWMFSSFIIGTLSRVLIVLGKQELKLFYDVSALLLFSGVFVTVSVMGIQLFPAIVIFSLSGIAAYALYAFLMHFSLKKCW